MEDDNVGQEILDGALDEMRQDLRIICMERPRVVTPQTFAELEEDVDLSIWPRGEEPMRGK
jgi:hypothetical protein